MMRRVPIGLALTLVVALGGCTDISTLARPDAPQVLTGSQLGPLVGADPDQIVAFAHSRVDDRPVWTQIPVQVDERKVVDFGAAPGSNATPGSTGTVYGGGSSVTALQYADPSTFVGSDPDPTFDADDELVFMVADAGGTPRDSEATEPPGVVPRSGVEVRLDEPLDTTRTGWVYLFVSPTLDPAAGADYVDYDFALDSGDYRTTYRRADGPNPESSRVTTDHYQIAYPDRWFETEWRITTGGATGIDLVDGVKNRFSLGTCTRSNASFADAEGAFVANIDGPVRGIRSYVGANSGPLTQRTHKMYRERETVETDLRVHAIPGVMDFVDYAPSATGMRYHNSVHPGGVPVDGSGDLITRGLASWHLVTGAHGSVFTTEELDSSMLDGGLGVDDVADTFFRDELSSAVQQCTGDPHFWGASGITSSTGIPNTDPRTAPAHTFRLVRTVRFAPPGASTGDAAVWSATVRIPLAVTVAPYLP